MKKIDEIAENVRTIRLHMVEKTPTHFDMRHVITAFFGALFFGFTFVLKGLLFDVGFALTNWELIMLTLATWIILTAEIYFVGYARVPKAEQQKRKFGQFWAKRFFAYYFIALFTSFMLLSLYGVGKFVADPYSVFKLVIAISLPTAVGAAAADLLGKY
ncbi:MAG: DUF2391 family protein [Candidatus Woesearchaeota archaeon]